MPTAQVSDKYKVPRLNYVDRTPDIKAQNTVYNTEKTERIEKLQQPKTAKDMKPLLGAVHSFGIFTKDISKLQNKRPG